MEITQVRAAADDLEDCEQFYSQVLGLQTFRSEGGSEVVVQVGATELRFYGDSSQGGYDHFAFTIPAAKFADAKRWLRERAELLTREGAEESEGPMGWNSRSIYFSGPSSSILELIARRDLPDTTAGPFTSADLLNVSEVGVPVRDVLEAASLARSAGVPPFAAAPSEEFAAVGDQRGLLILVAPRRPWLPTTDRYAVPREVSIVGKGAKSANLVLGGATVRIIEELD
jgi:catechol-2,3-dioxygenase